MDWFVGVFVEASQGVRTQLAEIVAAKGYEDAASVPDEMAWRLCRVNVYFAAAINDDAVSAALAAAQAAKGHELAEAAAERHYQAELERALAEHGLEEAVAMIHAEFFEEQD